MRKVALRVLSCAYLHSEESRQVVLDHLDSDMALPMMKEVLDSIMLQRSSVVQSGTNILSEIDVNRIIFFPDFVLV